MALWLSHQRLLLLLGEVGKQCTEMTMECTEKGLCTCPFAVSPLAWLNTLKRIVIHRLSIPCAI